MEISLIKTFQSLVNRYQCIKQKMGIRAWCQCKKWTLHPSSTEKKEHLSTFIRYKVLSGAQLSLSCILFLICETEIEATQLIVSFLNSTLWKFADGRGQKSVKAPSRSVYVTYAAHPKCWCNPPQAAEGAGPAAPLESRSPAHPLPYCPSYLSCWIICLSC